MYVYIYLYVHMCVYIYIMFIHHIPMIFHQNLPIMEPLSDDFCHRVATVGIPRLDVVLEGVNQALVQNGGTLLEFIGDEAKRLYFGWELFQIFWISENLLWDSYGDFTFFLFLSDSHRHFL